MKKFYNLGPRKLCILVTYVPVSKSRCGYCQPGQRPIRNKGIISYNDHDTNEEVHRKIQTAIGEDDELLSMSRNEN